MDRHDTLLIACGTPENRKLLRSVLEAHYNLLEAANTRQALLLLEQNISCIAAFLVDISAEETIDRELLSSDAFLRLGLPMMAITPDDSTSSLHTAFELGAVDAISIGYDSYGMRQRIENIVQLSLHKRNLQSMVDEQSRVLRNSNNAIVDALSSIIEYRSVESGQHILRIRHFTKILLDEVQHFCPEYGLTDSDVSLIASAAALHDIGKISIPDAILTKPGKLTPEEMETMRSHALTGCHILQRLGDLGDPDYMRYAHNICHYHHERWDGGGYPEGLAGDRIPICAQVVGLADVYDALTTQRVYKQAYSFDTAVNMILNGECGEFSPKLLECFKHVTEEYAALAMSYADGLSPNSENFDVTLPNRSRDTNDSMERTFSKYQALVHYAGAFYIELDLDQNLYHLVYNPYPEFSALQEMNNFSDIVRYILDEIIVPQQRQEMEALLTRGIPEFVRNGLRRVNHRFRFRSRVCPEGEDFLLTLLRIRPTDNAHNTLAVLCRKEKEDPHSQGETADVPVLGYTLISRYDRDFTLVRPGEDVNSLLGYSLQELQMKFENKLSLLILPEDRHPTLQSVRTQLQKGMTAQVEFRVRHKDGRILWMMEKLRLYTGPDGGEYLSCILTDITSSKEEVSQIRKRLQQYEIILAQTENVLFEWDVTTDRISFSDTWETLFGFAPISRDVMQALREGSYFHPDDLPLLFDRIGNMKQGSDYEMVELRMATSRGRYLWCRFRASAVRTPQGSLQKIVGIIINIDADKQAERALQEQAERDSLTKLLNNHAARKHSEAYFAQMGERAHCALLIIDLDDFKLVNDRFGHLFGDSVLRKVAAEIRKLFRNQDIIARIGGDEFMVLMRGISDVGIVRSRCNRLIAALSNAFRSSQQNLPIRCSIGVALAPEHGSTYIELFQKADKALYRAKEQGKNTFQIYQTQQEHYGETGYRTAVNRAIDSDIQPGLADGNIVQYAFRRLYTSLDVSAAVNDILDMIGRQTNVSRVYIFENSPDNRFCSNTYEWCNTGITPEIGNLQNISYETDIPNYEDNFNEQGIFYCPDINELPKRTYDIVAPQGIKSMLHCAIRDKGVFRGYIGFDECATQRYWTKEQIQVLSYFSEMLSVFLLKKQEQDRSNQRNIDLASILDNQNAWIYIIDPDTCELKYVNAKTHALSADVQPGMHCYSALMGRSCRCENCPAANIRKDKTCSQYIENPVFKVNALAEATLIQWEGEESCLLTCRQVEN